ncbi:MAG: GTPase Era [Xanthomonadaceae bacterium]|jgi:GTP-binding protein Era|nr:GTPase Era [Xanthomonadaceae bacterium]
MSTPFRSGTVAVVGRPNVGKSTLVNALVGFKVSIVAPKPQTTRHRITGVLTRDDGQIVFVDTPGLHDAGGHAINRQLNRAARGALGEADVIALVVEAHRWSTEDDAALAAAVQGGRPVVLVLNKVDRIADKGVLLPKIAELARRHAFAALVPLSAGKRDNLEALVRALLDLLPEGPPIFGPDEVTDRSERFIVAELVREQLVRQLHAELPYATTVEIEAFKRENKVLKIAAIVWVEREGQKGIVLGAGGAQIKRIGIFARREIERQFGGRVHLELHVKVREGWSDDEAALRQFGYAD